MIRISVSSSKASSSKSIIIKEDIPKIEVKQQPHISSIGDVPQNGITAPSPVSIIAKSDNKEADSIPTSISSLFEDALTNPFSSTTMFEHINFPYNLWMASGYYSTYLIGDSLLISVCEKGLVSRTVFVIGATVLNITPLIFAWYNRNSSNYWPIIWRSAFLGSIGAGGVYAVLNSSAHKSIGVYAIILSFFHFSEYFCVAFSNPMTCSTDSFLLNHSLEYGAAVLASVIEYSLESFFVSGIKNVVPFMIAGIVLCIFGEILRKVAMFTAGRSFTHLIASRKKSSHVLVTHGIYKFCRHPSYVGWFWWSLGTQILLSNPLCLIIYGYVSWSFFNERIYYEEETLLQFFGQQYSDYQRRVGTGLPFIRGKLRNN
uniref:Protein-S-isoprenylcysteine O-methyltransferase n=1 Tax=Romanomermis culicivorax TaxID=13658 RepID=A0A915K185_ROMCU